VLDTARSRQATRPPEHARDLKDIVLKDEQGKDVHLGELWRDRPAVLVLLRHYGCVFCRAQAVGLYRRRHDFEALGAHLVLIGQGTPEEARRFREMQTVDLPVLVDSDRRSYSAAGAKIATIGEIYRPGLVFRGLIRTLASRLRLGSIVVAPGKIQQHPAQLGGVLVVAPDGSIRYAHMSEDAGDVPDPRAVVAAVRAIRPHLMNPVHALAS
jgi:peroxiredoxin